MGSGLSSFLSRELRANRQKIFWKKSFRFEFGITQVKGEDIEETLQGASDGKRQTICLLKCCMSMAGASAERGRPRALNPPSLSMKCSIFEILPLTVSNSTQKKLACHPHLVSACFVSNFD